MQAKNKERKKKEQVITTKGGTLSFGDLDLGAHAGSALILTTVRGAHLKIKKIILWPIKKKMNRPTFTC